MVIIIKVFIHMKKSDPQTIERIIRSKMFQNILTKNKQKKTKNGQWSFIVLKILNIHFCWNSKIQITKRYIVNSTIVCRTTLLILDDQTAFQVSNRNLIEYNEWQSDNKSARTTRNKSFSWFALYCERRKEFCQPDQKNRFYEPYLHLHRTNDRKYIKSDNLLQYPSQS